MNFFLCKCRKKFLGVLLALLAVKGAMVIKTSEELSILLSKKELVLGFNNVFR